MTLGISVGSANTSLDSIFAAVFAKLHVGDPGAAAATSPAAGDATRKACTMAAAASGSKAMTGTAGPWTNVTTTETISHLSLWTAATVGTFLLSLALTTAQPWVNTNTLTLTSLTISYAPLAA
jgi:hypothetical protein